MSYDSSLQPPREIQPFILATHDHPCQMEEYWPLSNRRGSWSLWILRDGRAKWQRNGQTSMLLGQGQALLRWRGHGGQLHLPPGSMIRGVEFDVVARERVAHEQYGWQPLSGSGSARQPEPRQIFGQNPTHIITGPLAFRADRLLSRIATRWWRGIDQQLPCNLLLAGWLAELADYCSTPSGDMIDRAEDFARRTIGKECSVATMAAEVGLPISSFSERYVASRGVSPGHFIKQQRMQQAAQDLAETQYSVGKIGIRCGYRNAASFARAFKSFYGESPLNFRQRSRGL